MSNWKVKVARGWHDDDTPGEVRGAVAISRARGDGDAFALHTFGDATPAGPTHVAGDGSGRGAVLRFVPWLASFFAAVADPKADVVGLVFLNPRPDAGGPTGRAAPARKVAASVEAGVAWFLGSV